MTPSKTIILTGSIGSGKTACCEKIIAIGKDQGWKINGMLSPGVFDKGKKIGIDAVDLSTGERFRLANTRGEKSDGKKTKRWDFNQKTLLWGNTILGKLDDSDLLIIDELGPLEFEFGEGWINGVSAIDQGNYKRALIVVRPGLVEKALGRWPNATVISIHNSIDHAEYVEKIISIFE